MTLEIGLAKFGVFGIRWLYSGNTNAGIAWLVGVLIWEFVALAMSILTAGIYCLCLVPIKVVLVANSALKLDSYTKKLAALFG